MARGQRKKSAAKPSRESADNQVDFDPDKLSIVVEGQSKSFSQWTLEYSRHYYPDAGYRTYRVPPVDFNRQCLAEVTPLGFAELQAPKDEDRKKDRSQADVGARFEELGRLLEQATDRWGTDTGGTDTGRTNRLETDREGTDRAGPGRGLFIVSSAQYDNYLKDLKELRTKGSKPPPLPGEVAQRGELDFLVLHPHQGVVLIQVKGVGMADSWNPSLTDLQNAVKRRVKEAEKQLTRDVQVFQHIMADLDLKCGLHRVVALPFVSTQLLSTSLSDSGKAPQRGPAGELYLCSEHMSSRQAMSDWWRENIVREGSSPLNDWQLQSIVGRYCGLLSTVSVWTRSALRVEVRDVAEAAEEVGRRFASLVLTAQQRAALDRPEPLLYLHGPPGTGKSVLMVIKARQWLLQGHDVLVLNVDFGRPGNPVGHYIHNAINQWLVSAVSGESALSGKVKTSKKASLKTGRQSCGVDVNSFGLSGSDEADVSETTSVRSCNQIVSGLQKERKSSATDSPVFADSVVSERKVSDADRTSSETDTGSASSTSCSASSTSCSASSTSCSASSTSGSASSTSYSTSLASSSDGETYQHREMGQLFHVDFDLDGRDDQDQSEGPVERLLQLVSQQVRPGVPCHFLVDEFYWKSRLVPMVERLRQLFPTSRIWCAEVSADLLPPGFTPCMLTTVLRCPPAVQAVLREVDATEGHRPLYTADSTLQGLATDGFKPMLLEHRDHHATSPLDCPQCADTLLSFFRHELKLEFGCENVPDEGSVLQSDEKRNLNPSEVRDLRSGEARRHHTCKAKDVCSGEPRDPRSGKAREFQTGAPSPLLSNADVSSPSKYTHIPPVANEKRQLPLPKTKKRRTVCLPRRVQFSEIVVVFSYPRQCIKPASSLLLVQGEPKKAHHDSIQNSVFFRRMEDAGLPVVFRAPNSDAREIALPTEDRVLFTVPTAITGLERKVVVYVPCESTAYCYPVTQEKDPHPHPSPTVSSPRTASDGQMTSSVPQIPRELGASTEIRTTQVHDSVNTSVTKDAGNTREEETSLTSEEQLYKREISEMSTEDKIRTCSVVAAGIQADGDGAGARCPLNHHDIDKDVVIHLTGKGDDDFSTLQPQGSVLQSAGDTDNACNLEVSCPTHRPVSEPESQRYETHDADHPEGKVKSSGQSGQTDIPATAALCEEDWAKIHNRLLKQNQRGMFYAASRCLSVFVLIIP